MITGRNERAAAESSTSYLPANTQSLTPQVIVKGARAYADKLVELFDAKKLTEYPNPDGTLMFAVVQIGGSKLFLSDAGSFADATKANLSIAGRSSRTRPATSGRSRPTSRRSRWTT